MKLPPINHVWLIVLSDQSERTLFGKTSTAHYLNSTLVPQDTLLSNYYATSHGALADGIALLSGQGPTPEQQLGCPTYANVTPGTVDPGGAGQVHGHGCVLPTTVYSLPDQLSGNGLTWKAYIAGQDNATVPGAPADTCRHPVVGSADPTAALAAPADGYASRRNPFVYFHSIIDAPSSCAKTDVGLDQLLADLQSGKVPALSWIAPDPCAAGATGGCAITPPTTTTSSTTTTTSSTVSSSSSASSSSADTSTSLGSLSSSTSTTIGVLKARDAAAVEPNPTDAFLQQWIPKIEATAAYKKDGMIIILSDEAPASGPGADSSACCGKLSYVNTTNPGGAAKPGPGGGRTGALVLSTYAGRGVIDATPVDHFTLLHTLDDIFNVPYLGYALQRKDFDSVVFPSESGGSGAVSTRVHAGVAVITLTLTSASAATAPATLSAAPGTARNAAQGPAPARAYAPLHGRASRPQRHHRCLRYPASRPTEGIGFSVPPLGT